MWVLSCRGRVEGGRGAAAIDRGGGTEATTFGCVPGARAVKVLSNVSVLLLARVDETSTDAKVAVCGK